MLSQAWKRKDWGGKAGGIALEPISSLEDILNIGRKKLLQNVFVFIC